MIIKSEMAGTLLEWKIKVGDTLKPSQEIAIFESMKMEVPLLSKYSGKVVKLLKNSGDFINEGEGVLEIQS